MNNTCIIVDDEPIAHTILLEYLSAIQGITVTGCFFNAADAGVHLKEHKTDIMFLDIKMPGEDGLCFLRSLSNKPITILVTAFPDHALEAYNLDVIDYLVKPIRPERFKKALTKATEFLLLRKTPYSLQDVSAENFITIMSGKDQLRIDTNIISHIQALRDYMLIYTPPKKHIVRSTVTKLLALLPDDKFVRVHKSFIINRSMIKRIASSKIEIGEFVIPIGKNYKGSIIS